MDIQAFLMIYLVTIKTDKKKVSLFVNPEKSSKFTPSLSFLVFLQPPLLSLLVKR